MHLLQTRVKTLEDELAAALAKKQAESTAQSQRLSAMQIESDEMRAEVERQKNQIAVLQAASDEKDRQNEALKAQLQKETADAQTQREAVANLKRELEAQAISLKAKDERLNSLSDEISVLQQRVVDKEDIIKNLQQQLAKKPSDEKVKQLEDQLKLQKTKIEEINQKLLDVMLEKTVLQAEQEKQEKDYQLKIKEFQTKLDQIQAKLQAQLQAQQESSRALARSTRPLISSQVSASKGESKSEADVVLRDDEEESDSDSGSNSSIESESDPESEAETYPAASAPTLKKPAATLSSSSSSTRQPKLSDLKKATFDASDKAALFSAIFYNKIRGPIKTLVWDFYEKVNRLLFSQLPRNKDSESRGAIIYGIAAIITFAHQIKKYKTKTTQLYKLLAKYGDTQSVNNQTDADKIYLLMLIKYSLVLLDQELLSCLNISAGKKAFISLLKSQKMVLFTLQSSSQRRGQTGKYFTINQNEMLDFVLILADFIFNDEMTEQMLIQTLLAYAKTQKQTSPMDLLHHLTKQIPSFLSKYQVEIDGFIRSCKAKIHPKMRVPRDVIDLDICAVREDLIPEGLMIKQNNARVDFQLTKIGYFPVTGSAADEIMLPMSSSSSSSSAAAQPASKRRSKTSTMRHPQQVTLVKNKDGNLEIYDEKTHGPRNADQLTHMSFHEYDSLLTAEEKNIPKIRKRKEPATVASSQDAGPTQKRPRASGIASGSHADEKMMREVVASRFASSGSESDSNSDSDSTPEAEVTNDADLRVSDASSSSSSSSTMAVVLPNSRIPIPAILPVPAAVIADPIADDLSPRSFLEETPHACSANSSSSPHAGSPRSARLAVPGGPDLFAPPARSKSLTKEEEDALVASFFATDPADPTDSANPMELS